MSKRLQVLFEESELDEVSARLSRSQGILIGLLDPRIRLAGGVSR